MIDRDKLPQFFDECEDAVEMFVVRDDEHPDGPCVEIKWSRQGRGFGSYTFFKDNGKWKLDNECDHPITILDIIGMFLLEVEFVDNYDEKLEGLCK